MFNRIYSVGGANKVMCKFSIIIPFYNVRELLLERCIRSIEAQTYKDYEVIIINDGSKDEYVEILNSIQERYSNIIVYHQKNRGVSAARNKGTAMSTGDYILYVDSDDYISHLYLEEALNIIKKYKVEVIIGANRNTYDDNLCCLASDSSNKNIVLDSNEQIGGIKKWMLGHVKKYGKGIYLGQGPWNRIVDRGLALDTPFDESLAIGEDIVWNLQLLEKTKKICISEKAWYIYYVNSGSSSRRYREEAVKESYESLTKIKEYLNFDDDNQYKAFCFRCWSDLKRVYRCYLAYKKSGYQSVEKILYNNWPWNEIGSLRFRNMSTTKDKIMRELYVKKWLFTYYRIKSKLGL